jgi:3-deoxy-7-phosphoheptulonate synthase
LLIEVHPDPERAISDGVQSLYPDQFAQLMNEVNVIAQAVGRRMEAEPVQSEAARG